ncbi:MAG: colicin immunity domain-containing protein [Actinobacteria bacterium]|nr:colicin immunity domain-containing protein [Actinomycetota bacterium]MCA1705124.1 colicin immunity domain-containing protein [Actinomycetota bacterium]
MSTEKTPVATMLAAYRPIMARFLAGETSAEEFEREYLTTFKNDANQVLGAEFDVLDGLFADVDEYVADPALRAQVGGLGDDELKERVRAAHRRLFGP